MRVAELQHQRGELKDKCKAINEACIMGNRDVTAGEQRLYESYVSEIKEITAKLETHAAGAHLPADNHNNYSDGPVFPGPGNLARSNSVRSVLRDVFAQATPEQQEEIKALAGYLGGRVMASADLRPSGDGGVIIPSFVASSLERNYSAFAPVVSVARLFPTETGADTVFPVLSDSEEAEQLDAAASTGADASVSGDTPPTDLTGPTLKAYKASSKPVFVPRETMTDSPTDIVSEIIGALLARIIRWENKRFTRGTGSGQAEGFLTACSLFEADDPLSLDTALDLQYAVPALYRSAGVYMASDSTIKYLRQLATGISGDKRKLWEDADFTRGTPATLHGAPILVNNDMTDVAADGSFSGGLSSPLVYGDFKRFVVRQAEQNSPYIRRYEVPARDGAAVILFRRTDSKLLVSEAIAKLSPSGS
jgi:HK97 family phage major capsid protein